MRASQTSSPMVPLMNMFGYVNSLRSDDAVGGRATVTTMHFDHTLSAGECVGRSPNKFPDCLDAVND